MPGSVSALPLAEEGISVRSSARRVGPAGGLGQAPVDDQRLAILADDDVARLDVAVEHAPGVGVLDRVADVDEPAEQLAQLQRAAAGVAPSSAASAWKPSMASLSESPLMNRMA